MKACDGESFSVESLMLGCLGPYSNTFMAFVICYFGILGTDATTGFIDFSDSGEAIGSIGLELALIIL